MGGAGSSSEGGAGSSSEGGAGSFTVEDTDVSAKHIKKMKSCINRNTTRSEMTQEEVTYQ